MVLASSYARAENNQQIDILAVHSYHQEYPWTLSQYQAFKKQLHISLPEHTLNFSTEYLDTKRVAASKQYQKEFVEYLREKFNKRRPNLIYVTDDNALKFVHYGVNKLNWNIPVIFSGINIIDIPNPNPDYILAGSYEHKDIQASILLAKKISPNTSNIIFLGDGSETDIAIKKTIKDRRNQTDIYKLLYLSNSKLSNLLNGLKKYKESVVILTTIGGIYGDDGRRLSLKSIITALAKTGRKILVMEDAYLIKGVLGGHVTTGDGQGKSAAKTAARALRGQFKDNIGKPYKIPSDFILSEPEMNKFDLNIKDKSFSKAAIINKSDLFKEQYSIIIDWLLGIVIFLLLALIIYIIKSKQKSKLLKEQYTDKLTGLSNRVKLIYDIENAETPCLIIVDIINFKSINNLYGMLAGDKLIKEFSSFIRDNISSNYRAYRVGGNQFGILNSNELAPDKATSYIKGFLDSMQNKIYRINNLEVNVTLTAGISRNERDQLIPRTEQALQRAKISNQSICIINDAGEDDDLHQKNLLWAQKVNQALASDNIVPYYQAIIHNKTGVINKFEALVRLIDEEGRVVTPFHFLEAAKSTRQYAALTKTVIEKTFKAIGEQDISVSINFTVNDIRNEDTIVFFKESLKAYNIANKIIIELTESEGIESYSEIADFISEMQSLGCRVAIDDFGTGYSNFTHLIHLNVDYLKIDGSIIKNIVTDKNAAIVAKTLVEFARQLGIETVAEFVDSQEVQDKVIELGIDYSQGYFIGKPGSKISEK